jgi:signal transduction histidine kinase
MLSFSRRSDSLMEHHDLASLLERTVDLIRNDYDMKKRFDFRNILIVREYGENVPKVFCDPGKIQQVFFNILKNGAQAMMEPGTGQAQPRFVLGTHTEKDRVCASIQDNGPGMSPEIRSRIFEPFFTTKPVGVGTGLGLYVSYFIVAEDHGGTITVDSSPEGGTTFFVKLPLGHP